MAHHGTSFQAPGAKHLHVQAMAVYNMLPGRTLLKRSLTPPHTNPTQALSTFQGSKAYCGTTTYPPTEA